MEAAPNSVSVYENAVPAFVGPALEALHQHVFSSMPQFRAYDGIDENTHTYVARDSGKPSAVLLFRLDGRRVRVLNEQISMSSREIMRFVRHVFASYPAADMVIFHAIRSGMRRLPFPCQEFYRTEDIVLSLPASADDYMNSLGKATRKNMKYHGNRLKRNYPALKLRIELDGDIDEQHVHDIIALNRARMAAKNKSSDMDATEAARLLRLVRQGGLVSVMLLDGRVVAGTVCSRVGANYFMHINAHDPAYDDARLGKLCCFMTICDCIGRGGKEFHFMWGRFEYKYQFLGVQQDFNELIVYRSAARMLRHAASALRTAFDGYAREWKFRLLDVADHPGHGNAALRALSRFVNAVRSLKRSSFLSAQRY
jgi:hypothetical protein